MLKFSDIDGKINPELQDKLHRAQDAVAEKEAQVANLQTLISKAKSTLDSDQVRLNEAIKSVNEAHKRHGDNVESLETAMATARKDKGILSAKVQQGEERIDDLSQGLTFAKQEQVELAKVRDRCRLHIMRGLKLVTDAPQRPLDKARLLTLETINIEELICTFFLQNELRGMGTNPFAGDRMFARKLFEFLAHYVGVPGEEDIAIMRSRYEALIWGDYDVPVKGGRGRVPSSAHTPVNFDLVGGTKGADA